MQKLILSVLLSLASLSLAAQRTSVEAYIEQFKDIAISEMKRSGVPASITLAQGILESESGNSILVKKSNNHFGIKCKSNWTGETVKHDDDENSECFRVYKNAEESYRDHSDFLKTGTRYSALFNLDPADYSGWARGLKKAGYATNPRYPDMLIKHIEQYNLQQYSLMALNELPDTAVAPAQATIPVLPEATIEEKSNGINEPELMPEGWDKLLIVNKTKAVFVKKGTSLLAIASKYHIDLSKLMDFNDMAEDGLLEKDQLIFLQKKSKIGEQEYYIVEQGESLHDISQKIAVQLKYLMEYNGLKSGTDLKVKRKLFLRPGFQQGKNSKDDSNSKVHVVAPKEGLYSIAKTYNITVGQLQEWNKLGSDNLMIGQEIIVSK